MKSQRKSSILSAFASILLLLFVWEVGALIVDANVIPPVHTVFAALFREIQGDLGRHVIASLLRVLASMCIAVITAAPLGVMLGQSKTLNHIVSPFIYVLYPIPKVVLVPVMLLLMGVGNLPKILIITAILFFQILVLVRDAALTIRPELVQSVRSLGAGRRALFRFVYAPASIPAILTSLRQSIGTAVAVLYVAELFATRYGLGYYIYYQGSTLFDYPRMYAGIIAMSFMGLVLYNLVDGMQRWLCPWLHQKRINIR